MQWISLSDFQASVVKRNTTSRVDHLHRLALKLRYVRCARGRAYQLLSAHTRIPNSLPLALNSHSYCLHRLPLLHANGIRWSWIQPCKHVLQHCQPITLPLDPPSLLHWPERKVGLSFPRPFCSRYISYSSAKTAPECPEYISLQCVLVHHDVCTCDARILSGTTLRSDRRKG